MGSLSLWHWLILGMVITLLFGRGRISALMEDLGKGLQSFRNTLREADISKTVIGRDEP